jgi:hypothetical protein
MERISKHISYKEATYSPTAERKGITNSPTEEHLGNMERLAENVFEKAREHFGEPIYINSFYRSITLNSVIGGSKTSEHCSGQAMDIRMGHNSKFTNSDLFHWIKDNCEYNQMIWEFGNDDEPRWVHVSYAEGINRKQLLRAKRVDGKTSYSVYH